MQMEAVKWILEPLYQILINRIIDCVLSTCQESAPGIPNANKEQMLFSDYVPIL